MSQIAGKVVLVTGGSGSIGSELVRALLDQQAKVVRVLVDNENELYEFGLSQRDPRLRLLLGNIRDQDRLARAMSGVDLVYHAAALKHVPLCEYNPGEAVKTNVLGTQNVIDAALRENVENLIMISTDKAVNPVSTMGATKLLAERLITDASLTRGDRRTVLATVRFGNVMGSRGSVIPLFKDQLARGEPLTVTDPAMTRFMMSIPQAISLIFKAQNLAVGGELFIFKMPTMRMGDLAKTMTRLAGGSGQITEVGARPGEKLHEELMTTEEALRALEMPNMFVVLPLIDANITRDYPGATSTSKSSYRSNDQEPLDDAGIEAELKGAGLI